MYLRQSTAGQEILLGPFLDSTDGNTQETALTIANTDIKLWKDGAIVEANKNSGGATHIAGGRYYCVLDATDTDTRGNLEVNCHPTGATPSRREFVVLAANVYDSLVAASDNLQVDTVQVSGTAQTANDNGADLNTLITGVIVATNNDKTGYSLTQAFPINFADLAITATTGQMTVGTNNDKSGYSLSVAPPTSAQIRAEIDTNSTKLDVAVSTRNAVAPDNATITAIAGYLDTEVAAIKAKTDQLTFTKANELDTNVQSINGGTITGDGKTTPYDIA